MHLLRPIAQTKDCVNWHHRGGLGEITTALYCYYHSDNNNEEEEEVEEEEEEDYDDYHYS